MDGRTDEPITIVPFGGQSKSVHNYEGARAMTMFFFLKIATVTLPLAQNLQIQFF